MDVGNISLNDDVLPEDDYELADGTVVRNLQDLAGALKKMSKDDFSLHVTKNRNDFAEWIFEAYNDERLTQKLFGAKDKEKMIKILRTAIKENSKISKIDEKHSKKEVLGNLKKLNNGM